MNAKTCRAIACAAAVAACAGQDGKDPTGTSETTSALDETAHPIYVVVQSEGNACLPGTAACGVVRVREANERGKARFVRLDESSLARAAIEQMAGAQDGELVLRGVLAADNLDGRRPPLFTVLEAWRGMPGVEASLDSAYVRVEMNDGHLFAQFLDEDRRHPIRDVSFAAGVEPLGNGEWLTSRVLARYALVAGTFDRGTLDATQVFVHLPDVAGPCPLLILHCQEGTVATYNRDANHCLLPSGCVSRGVCPMFIPACDSGYTLASWATKPSACAGFACDPSFIHAH